MPAAVDVEPAGDPGGVVDVALAVEFPASDAALDGRPGDGGRHLEEHPRVQRLGDGVLGAVLERFVAVGLDDGVR